MIGGTNRQEKHTERRTFRSLPSSKLDTWMFSFERLESDTENETKNEIIVKTQESPKKKEKFTLVHYVTQSTTLILLMVHT